MAEYERPNEDFLNNDNGSGSGLSASQPTMMSGYLVLEQPNNSVLSFSKVVSKRLWFVMDDSHCLLAGYDGPDKVNKPAVTTIELNDATITIDATADNTFTLNCAGKHYNLRCNNNEVMTMWIQAIQSLRTLRRKSSTSASSQLATTSRTDSSRRINRSQSIPANLRPENRRLTPVLSREAIAECDDDETESYSRKDGGEQDSSGKRSLSFAIADIAMRCGTEPAKPTLGIPDATLARRSSRSSINRSPTPQTQTMEQEDSATFALSPFSSSSVANFRNEDRQRNALADADSRSDDSLADDYGTAATDSIFLKDLSLATQSNQENAKQLATLQEKLDQRDVVIQSLNIQLGKREKDLTEMDERIHILEMQLKQSQDTTMRTAAKPVRRFSFFGGSATPGVTEPDVRSLQVSANEDQLIESCKILTNKNQFLNGEIKRLEMLTEEEREKVRTSEERVNELTEDIVRARLGHLKTLQTALMCLTLNPKSCAISVTGRDSDTPSDGMKVLLKMVDSAMCDQLKVARVNNRNLPTLELLTSPNKHYVDKHGFKHSFFVEETNPNGDGDARNAALEALQRVICRVDMLTHVSWQLHQHYCDFLAAKEPSDSDDLSADEAWSKRFADATATNLKATFRNLIIQNAVPPRYRSELWRTLIRNSPPVQRKLKKLGTAFYTILAKQAQEDQQIYSNKYARQIAVDLLRTMPSNVHFESINASKIKKLSEVLLAFLRYNSAIGYYQGMNFIAANALLFLEKEDAFWLLVALTEHFFHREQFFPDLIGLQADQLVLKDLIEMKLPRLFQHLKRLEMDIEVVSFTWFATLFFNALRFETLIRIWDCFLVDGRKFLFRVSLALLRQHEDLLLQQPDALSVWRCLKLANQTVVSAEELIASAYQDFFPFPKRKVLDQKQATYIENLRKTLNIKITEKQHFMQVENDLRKMENDRNSLSSRQMYFHACPAARSQAIWFSYGESTSSRLSLIDVDKRNFLELEGDFDAEVTSMCTVAPQSGSGCIILVTFANGRFCAFDHATKQRLWHNRISESILCCLVVYCNDVLSASIPVLARIFCGTADGSLVVMEIVRLAGEPSVFFVNLCQSPITAVFHLPQCDMVVCASQDKLHAVAASTLDRRRMHELQPNSVEEKQSQSQSQSSQQSNRNRVAYHRKHIAFAQTFRDQAICIVRKYSSVLEFYNVVPARPKSTSVCVSNATLLVNEPRKTELTFEASFVYDICQDGMSSGSRHASGEANLRALHYRISALLVMHDVLWVGSSCGEIFVYELSDNTDVAKDDALEEKQCLFTPTLRMKNKLSELPVTEFIAINCCDRTNENGSEPEQVQVQAQVKVISFAGCYGDDESVLLWQKADQQEAAIWTNEPLDLSTRKPLLPPSARAMHKLKQDASELTVSAMQQTIARDATVQRLSTDDGESTRKRNMARRKMSVY